MEELKRTIMKKMMWEYSHYLTLSKDCENHQFPELAKEYAHKAQAIRDMILMVDGTNEPVKDLSKLDYPTNDCFFEEGELLLKLKTTLS